MSKSVRIDKYLADMGIGSRSEVKSYIKKYRIMINDLIVTNPNLKVDIEHDYVYFDNQMIEYKSFEYYMLNKPAGVISATRDNMHKTVADIVISKHNNELFPIGRLDIDTEGMLIMTNDGELAHNLLSPRRHVAKTYYADVKGNVTENEIELFNNGLKVDKDFTALGAKLSVVGKDNIENEIVSHIYITIMEGKFHQIKRMFETVKMKVIYLKRVSMGNLSLDINLKPGEFRELTNDEISILKQ